MAAKQDRFRDILCVITWTITLNYNSLFSLWVVVVKCHNNKKHAENCYCLQKVLGEDLNVQCSGIVQEKQKWNSIFEHQQYLVMCMCQTCWEGPHVSYPVIKTVTIQKIHVFLDMFEAVFCIFKGCSSELQHWKNGNSCQRHTMLQWHDYSDSHMKSEQWMENPISLVWGRWHKHVGYQRKAVSATCAEQSWWCSEHDYTYIITSDEFHLAIPEVYKMTQDCKRCLTMIAVWAPILSDLS